MSHVEKYNFHLNALSDLQRVPLWVTGAVGGSKFSYVKQMAVRELINVSTRWRLRLRNRLGVLWVTTLPTLTEVCHYTSVS